MDRKQYLMLQEKILEDNSCSSDKALLELKNFYNSQNES